MLGELTGEVSAADHPHTTVARGRDHRRVQLAHVAGGERISSSTEGRSRWVSTQQGTS